jgi:hypothetical protein
MVALVAQPAINMTGKSFKNFFHIVLGASHITGLLVKLDYNTSTRNPKFKRPSCRNLLGGNALEKSHQTTAGMASIFPRCFHSNILPQLGRLNFGFRVEPAVGFR